MQSIQLNNRYEVLLFEVLDQTHLINSSTVYVTHVTILRHKCLTKWEYRPEGKIIGWGIELGYQIIPLSDIKNLDDKTQYRLNTMPHQFSSSCCHLAE